MKKLFKLFSIALLGCSLVLVSCGKDENDDQNNNNNNNNENTDPGTDPGNDPDPDAALAINWGGQNQVLNHIDPYHVNSTVYYVIAAKDMGENYENPIFRFGLDLDTDPSFGCALTATYVYGENPVSGNTLFPTDVVEDEYYASDKDQTLGIVGDWQLDMYTIAEPDFSISNAQFDPNAGTLTASLTVQMFSYSDIIPALQAQYGSEEEQEIAINNAIVAARKKNLAVTFRGLKFSEEKQAKNAMDLVKKVK